VQQHSQLDVPVVAVVVVVVKRLSDVPMCFECVKIAAGREIMRAD
jgi:hypothetical protein